MKIDEPNTPYEAPLDGEDADGLDMPELSLDGGGGDPTAMYGSRVASRRMHAYVHVCVFMRTCVCVCGWQQTVAPL
jgi:hypothetical protein